MNARKVGIGAVRYDFELSEDKWHPGTTYWHVTTYTIKIKYTGNFRDIDLVHTKD